jgi:hypothetical protein
LTEFHREILGCFVCSLKIFAAEHPLAGIVEHLLRCKYLLFFDNNQRHFVRHDEAHDLNYKNQRARKKSESHHLKPPTGFSNDYQHAHQYVNLQH